MWVDHDVARALIGAGRDLTGFGERSVFGADTDQRASTALRIVKMTASAGLSEHQRQHRDFADHNRIIGM